MRYEDRLAFFLESYNRLDKDLPGLLDAWEVLGYEDCLVNFDSVVYRLSRRAEFKGAPGLEQGDAAVRKHAVLLFDLMGIEASKFLSA